MIIGELEVIAVGDSDSTEDSVPEETAGSVSELWGDTENVATADVEANVAAEDSPALEVRVGTEELEAAPV